MADDPVSLRPEVSELTGRILTAVEGRRWKEASQLARQFRISAVEYGPRLEIILTSLASALAEPVVDARLRAQRGMRLDYLSRLALLASPPDSLGIALGRVCGLTANCAEEDVGRLEGILTRGMNRLGTQLSGEELLRLFESGVDRCLAEETSVSKGRVAANLLARIGTAEATERLIGLVHARHPSWRAIEGVRRPESLSLLAQEIERSDDPEVTSSLVKALTHSGERGSELLRSLVESYAKAYPGERSFVLGTCAAGLARSIRDRSDVELLSSTVDSVPQLLPSIVTILSMERGVLTEDVRQSLRSFCEDQPNSTLAEALSSVVHAGSEERPTRD